MSMTTRRSFITGLISFVAAPAIVRAGSLMPVKVMPVEPGLMTLEEYARRVLLPATQWRSWNAHWYLIANAIIDDMPFKGLE